MRRSLTWPAWLGARQSVGLLAWAFLTPVSVVAAPLAAIADIVDATELLHWMLLGLVAQLPLGLVLLLGGRLLRLLSYPRPMVVVVALLAGASRGAVIAHLGHSPGIETRVVASAITMTIWLVAFGAALQAHDRYRGEVDALLAQLVARELQGRLMDESATDAARAESAERISKTSDELRAIVTDGSPDHARTAALLQAAIETTLRPLSHDLWFSPAPIAPQARYGRGLVRRIATAPIPVGPVFVAALALLTWGSYVLHGVWQGLVVGAVIAAVYAATLTAANAMNRRPWVGAITRYLGVMLLPAAAGSVVLAIEGLGYRLSPIAVALGLPLITVAVAAAGIAREDQSEIIADLRARLADPQWDRHLGALVRRHVDVQSATMLHNAVQPALTAAALQLQLAASSGDPERARSALGRAARALDEATGAERPADDGRDRLNFVTEAWSGIARVTLCLDESELSAPEWSLLADVIEESTANAVRHGHATEIDIVVASTPTAITISLVDNGRAERTEAPAGLGRSWLSTVLASAVTAVLPDGRVRSLLTVARERDADSPR